MKRKILIILLIITLAIIPSVTAIGISPAKMDIHFEPNLNTTLSFVAINTESKGQYFQVYSKYDLDEYFHPTEQFLYAQPHEAKEFTVDVALPDMLKPGRHIAHVGVVEITEAAASSNTFISAITGAESLINVIVPYEGVYISLTIDASNVNVGEPVNFAITAENAGKDTLVATQIMIDIYSENEKITTIYTEAKDILGESKQTYDAKWTSTLPGTYKAIATLVYNGKQIHAETNFKVGYLFVKIVNVIADDILMGTIGKIDVLLESEWNSPIDAQVSALVKKDGNVIHSVPGENIRLGPWGAKTTKLYLDTANINAGTYDLLVIAAYEGKTTEYASVVNVVKYSKATISLIATITVMLLILSIALAYMYIKLISTSKSQQKELQKANY